MEHIKLSNGVKIPQLGYGVYQVTPEECERCVSDALSVGYRMIDTAQAYAMEKPFRKWHCAGCCSAGSSSSRSQHTRNE